MCIKIWTEHKVKKETVMKKKIIFALAVITTAIYMVWRIGWSLPVEKRAVDMIFGILLLVAEVIGFIEAANYMTGMVKDNKIEKPEIPEEEYPEVDVFIATYNEETELLRKTVNGCLNMDYPDKSKVHIYICDDNDREEMATLAKRMGVGYFRRDNNEGAKAGNLNNALRQTTSPLVATFDADMIPMHDFLTTVVPYFFMDRYEKKDNKWTLKDKPGKKIGFVQTPQSFYNADLFQYNLFSENSVPNEQNFFFQTIQLSRNSANAAIYAGSNTILSREALEEVGGFYENAITEDLATGLCIQTSGYQTFALGEVHANGLAPTDLKSLFKQRDRWARGCIQTFRQLHLFTRKGMSSKQRKSYISALLYWYTPIRRMFFLLSPILFAVFNIYLLDCRMQEVLCVWLPHYVFYTLALGKLSGRQRTSRVSNIYDTILSFQLIPGVILETFGIKKSKFEVTKKKMETDDESIWKRISFAIPQLILIVLSIVGIVICLGKTIYFETAEYAIILGWLIVNLYYLVMAVFFVVGRKYFRQKERFYVALPVVLEADNWKKEVKTKDISEGGFSFELEIPEYVPSNEAIQITVSDEEKRYTAHLTGSIIHVAGNKGTWRYAVKFEEISEKEQLQLYQIVYDRVPTLPQEITNHSSFYEDLKNNIHMRKQSNRPSNRKQPRVDIKRKFKTDKGYDVWVEDFDYIYVLVKNKGNKYDEKIKLYDEKENINFECSLEKLLTEKSNGNVQAALYRLDNEKDFRFNKEFEQLLSKWESNARKKNEMKREQLKKSQRQNPYEYDEGVFL